MSSHFTDPGYLIGAILGIVFYYVEKVLSMLPVDAQTRINVAIENGTRPTLMTGGIGYAGYAFTDGDPIATAVFATLGLLATIRDRRVVKKNSN